MFLFIAFVMSKIFRKKFIYLSVQDPSIEISCSLVMLNFLMALPDTRLQCHAFSHSTQPFNIHQLMVCAKHFTNPQRTGLASIIVSQTNRVVLPLKYEHYDPQLCFFRSKNNFWLISGLESQHNYGVCPKSCFNMVIQDSQIHHCSFYKCVIPINR